MGTSVNYKETIAKQLDDLSPELIREVIDFIEFLKTKRLKTNGVDFNTLLVEQESLSRIWDSESEDVYEL